ncbi:hypothetical protein EQG49_06730 [Periweissella cryptocerci]|uniref:ABC transporter permease n=1 Tax=Periweissella cryptocerci TaxID=2506420 RepID=A0A4P6YTZ9_9LACO|nr:hypothetical protein [Periweissella cryptocerci]QBO36176.1 hypothetical protein EQG49_06730 [Periweissella cryptocerci]
MVFDFKRTRVIAQHSIKEQIKTSAFWTSALWPITSMLLLVSYVVIKYGDSDVGIAFASKFLPQIMAPLLTVMLIIPYMGMIAASIVEDKTSKLSELLIAQTGFKAQVLGKFYATLLLVCGNLLSTFVVLLWVDKYLHSQIIRNLIHYYAGWQVINLTMSILLTVGFTLVLSIWRSANYRDEEQLSKTTWDSVVVAMVIVVFATSLIKSNVANNLFFQYISMIIPGIGDIFIGSTISVKWYMAVVMYGIHIVILSLSLKYVIRYYSVHILSKH